MPHLNTYSGPLWAKINTLPELGHWEGGLLTDEHHHDLIQASLRDYHAALAETLSGRQQETNGGLILPRGDFDTLVSNNMAVKKRGPIFRKTLWALYRDILDRDATHLFWRMYYCNRKAPVLIEGEPRMERQKRCQSMFCPSCRERQQKRRQKRALQLFGHRPHDRLYWLTILYKCPTDLDGIRALVDAFKGEVKQAFNKADGVGPVQFQGAMEIDLKRPSLYDTTNDAGEKEQRAHSKQALAAMGIHLDDPSCPPRWWLVHYHALVDIGDNDPDCVRQVLKNAFTGSHRVRLSTLYSENKSPKDQSIKNLASYQLKSKLQYAENIFADDPSRPNKSCYGKAYEQEAVAELCKAFDGNGNIDLVKFDYGVRRFHG